jgi:TetR/AcrR family transcriptional repressor of nem operon
MRRSRQEAAETRRHIIESAATEFCNNGIDGTGLAGLMAAAGFTHGGFYKHFESKEQVVEDALTLSFESMVGSAQRALSASADNRGLQTLISRYLSVDHRDDAGHGCPLAALGCEIARGSDSVREAVTIGFLEMVDLMADQIDGMPPTAARKEALWMFSTMVGAVTMARIVTDPEVSAAILRETRRHLIRPSVKSTDSR